MCALEKTNTQDWDLKHKCLSLVLSFDFEGNGYDFGETNNS